jgi:hypothetical protein
MTQQHRPLSFIVMTISRDHCSAPTKEKDSLAKPFNFLTLSFEDFKKPMLGSFALDIRVPTQLHGDNNSFGLRGVCSHLKHPDPLCNAESTLKKSKTDIYQNIVLL